MKDPREDVGTNDCKIDKIVESWMKWTGHIVRVKDERSPKISQKKKQEGCGNGRIV